MERSQGVARKLVITFPLEAELVERIVAAAPGFEVSVLGREAQRQSTREAFYPSQLQAITPVAELRAGIAGAEVLFGHWGAGAGALADFRAIAPSVRWVQLSHAGAEDVDPALIEAGVTFTTASGLAARPMAEWVIGTMIVLAKGWPRLFREQQAHYYRRFVPRDIWGATVGVIGMGQIGAEVARLAKGLGCRVLGMRRSYRRRGPDPVADEAVPPAELDYLLAESDFVVLAAPLTEETFLMIGSAQLARMKPDAFLINVGRGALIAEDSLIEALREHRIGGAALDVFSEEPVAPDSPLWDLDNLLMSPHISGGTPRYNVLATEIFCGNLRRYLAGEPLENVYEPDRGY
jgi:phosphoglycerate dehydrogenase-like enzyme